jgi:homoserine dehydrogenase
MKTARIAIIGKGNIGNTLAERAQALGHQISAHISRSEFKNHRGDTVAHTFDNFATFIEHYPEERPEILCLAIPTLDTGEIAAQLITDALSLGIHVVTCEKGSLSYHADELLTAASPAQLRYSASVGGGTMMLPYMYMRNMQERVIQMDAVINGTCNFIFHQTAQSGRTLGEACDEAARLGYAEPGSKEPLSLINGELKDVRMKTCVLFNTVLAQKLRITPRDLGSLSLNEATLDELSRYSGSVRLVVQFTNTENAKIAEYSGCQFVTSVDGWTIQGGFRNLQKEPELLQWLPGGVGNAIHITEGKLGSGGRYTLTGPGAGAEATTSAMLNDIHEILTTRY